jgi:hypothetical protein
VGYTRILRAVTGEHYLVHEGVKLGDHIINDSGGEPFLIDTAETLRSVEKKVGAEIALAITRQSIGIMLSPRVQAYVNCEDLNPTSGDH